MTVRDSLSGGPRGGQGGSAPGAGQSIAMAPAAAPPALDRGRPPARGGRLPDTPERPQVRGAAAVGLAILMVFFGGLGVWAALAPLSSAAVAPGIVVVDSNRKTVQHLEGGIIKELRVRDGDFVNLGQVLLRLNDSQAGAAWQLLRGQVDASQALEARLRAERDGAETIAFAAGLTGRRAEPAVRQILDGQETIFRARRKAIAGQTAILRQKIEQLQSEISGRRAQITAAKRQKSLIGEEVAGLQELVEKGLERRPRLLALQRQSADLDGRRGEQLGLLARAQQQIGETQLQIISLYNNQLNEVVAELRDVQIQLRDLYERERAARDVLDRLEVRAPLAGRVVNQRYFTAGGVISPGDNILDIVPADDKLIIESRVEPTDIDVVAIGMPAQITLSAFKQRTTPTLNGRVIYVSADALVDPQTGVTYYAVRVEIPTEELARLDGAGLTPGMPAQVMIVTGERTALQYLFDPLRESLRRAFREQ